MNIGSLRVRYGRTVDDVRRHLEKKFDVEYTVMYRDSVNYIVRKLDVENIDSNILLSNIGTTISQSFNRYSFYPRNSFSMYRNVMFLDKDELREIIDNNMLPFNTVILLYYRKVGDDDELILGYRYRTPATINLSRTNYSDSGINERESKIISDIILTRKDLAYMSIDLDLFSFNMPEDPDAYYDDDTIYASDRRVGFFVVPTATVIIGLSSLADRSIFDQIVDASRALNRLSDKSKSLSLGDFMFIANIVDELRFGLHRLAINDQEKEITDTISERIVDVMSKYKGSKGKIVAALIGSAFAPDMNDYYEKIRHFNHDYTKELIENIDLDMMDSMIGYKIFRVSRSTNSGLDDSLVLDIELTYKDKEIIYNSFTIPVREEYMIDNKVILQLYLSSGSIPSVSMNYTVYPHVNVSRDGDICIGDVFEDAPTFSMKNVDNKVIKEIIKIIRDSLFGVSNFDSTYSSNVPMPVIATLVEHIYEIYVRSKQHVSRYSSSLRRIDPEYGYYTFDEAMDIICKILDAMVKKYESNMKDFAPVAAMFISLSEGYIETIHTSYFYDKIKKYVDLIKEHGLNEAIEFMEYLSREFEDTPLVLRMLREHIVTSTNDEEKEEAEPTHGIAPPSVTLNNTVISAGDGYVLDRMVANILSGASGSNQTEDEPTENNDSDDDEEDSTETTNETRDTQDNQPEQQEIEIDASEVEIWMDFDLIPPDEDVDQ